MAKTTGFRHTGGGRARTPGTGRAGVLASRAQRGKEPAKPSTRRGDVVEVLRADYESLLRRIEDLEDIRAIDQARADPDREELPVEMVERLLFGRENPVVVWRQHRGLSQRALAEKAGMQPGYLSEIENGKKPGSVRALAAIARALKVDIEDLISRDP